jgi:hypothetical protein
MREIHGITSSIGKKAMSKPTVLMKGHRVATPDIAAGQCNRRIAERNRFLDESILPPEMGVGKIARTGTTMLPGDRLVACLGAGSNKG